MRGLKRQHLIPLKKSTYRGFGSLNDCISVRRTGGHSLHDTMST